MHSSFPCIFATIKDLPVNSTPYLIVFDTIIFIFIIIDPIQKFRF